MPDRIQKLSPSVEADLRELVDPVADYISATDESRLALVVAIFMLLQNVHDINTTATKYLDSRGGIYPD